MQVDVGIVVSLVTAAATVGIALGRQGAQAVAIKELQRSRDKLGERVGNLEKHMALEQQARRHLTRPGLQAVPRKVDDGGDSDEHTGGSE